MPRAVLAALVLGERLASPVDVRGVLLSLVVADSITDPQCGHGDQRAMCPAVPASRIVGIFGHGQPHYCRPVKPWESGCARMERACEAGAGIKQSRLAALAARIDGAETIAVPIASGTPAPRREIVSLAHASSRS